MRLLLTLLIFVIASVCSGQNKEYYSSFSSAFENVDSVTVISINCMHNNELKTDGCSSLPEDIDMFYNLSELYISESLVKTLPNSIINLKRLKQLSLNYLPYFKYSTELCKLSELDSLEYLGLWMAGIKTLPTCIGKIKTLRSLNISHNYNLNIGKAFLIFKKLPNLRMLDIGGIDSLSVIPKDIVDLKNLKSLFIDFLPANFDYKTSFERLESLELDSLSLTNNRLKSLNSAIKELKDLKYINLSDNFFEHLPTELFELINLKQIIIQHNNTTFKFVGKEISKLTILEKINLGGNWKIDGVQTIINLSILPNLKELDFFACRLDTIPEEIKNLVSLQKLNLVRNPEIDFADLFEKLSFISSLKYLDLSQNNLTTLPKEIGLLTSLEYLIIGQNNISSLPEEFFNLQNLKILNVYGNYDNRISEDELVKIKRKMPNCKIIDEWVFRD